MSREMTDREIIKVCAEICGLDFPFITLRSTGTLKPFRPLTDSNDERRVLEAVREWELHGGYMSFVWELAAAKPCRQSMADYLLSESNVGDISRAAAKARGVNQ